MKSKNFRYHAKSFTKISVTIVCVTVALFVNAQSKPGIYFFSGASQWNNLTSTNTVEERAIFGSDVALNVGLGYKLSERWSIETTYTKFDELFKAGVIPARNAIINSFVQSDSLSFGPALEMPLSRYVKSFVKTGVVRLRHNSTVYVSTATKLREETHVTNRESHLFASLGFAVPIKRLNSMATLSYTRTNDASKKFSRSIEFNWRLYY